VVGNVVHSRHKKTIRNKSRMGYVICCGGFVAVFMRLSRGCATVRAARVWGGCWRCRRAARRGTRGRYGGASAVSAGSKRGTPWAFLGLPSGAGVAGPVPGATPTIEGPGKASAELKASAGD